MPARTLPNLGLRGFYADGEDGWGTALSADLLKLSVLAQGGVSASVAAEPANPAAGTVILRTDTKAIGVFDAGAWVYYAPNEGWLVYDRGADKYLSYSGADWVALSSGGGVAGGTSGFRKLQTIDLGGKNAVSFDNIPATGVGLRLVVTGGIDGSQSEVSVRLNNIGDGVYDMQRVYSNSLRQASPASDHFRGDPSWQRGGTLPNGIAFTGFVAYEIENYTQVGGTKIGSSVGRQPDESVSAYHMLCGLQARIGPAVNSVQVSVQNGGNFVAGSKATLYVIGEDPVAAGYRVGGFFTRTPDPSETVLLHVATEGFTLPALLAGTKVNIGGAPTGDVVLTIQKNGVAVGTITLKADKTAVLASDGTTVTVGDLISIVAPADSRGAANVAFTIKAI